MLTFIPKGAPAGGKMTVIGGEIVNCYLNGNPVLSFKTKNNCGTVKSTDIPSGAFMKEAINTLECTVRGVSPDSDNGFKLSYFAYDTIPASPPVKKLEIREELRRNIEESGELVVFSTGTEFRVKRGKAQDFYIGIRNTATEKLCFLITMNCITPFTPGASCDPNKPGEKVAVGGLTLPGEEPPVGENWFPSMLSKLEIKPGDVEVIPVKLQVGGSTKTDVYQMEANIYQGTGDCSNPGFPDPTSPWQSKRFYISIK